MSQPPRESENSSLSSNKGNVPYRTDNTFRHDIEPTNSPSGEKARDITSEIVQKGSLENVECPQISEKIDKEVTHLLPSSISSTMPDTSSKWASTTTGAGI